MTVELPQRQPGATKRKKKRVWLAVTMVVLIAIIGYILWRSWSSESVDGQLAAIEAARAIPPEENAATIYNRLLQDPNATSLGDYRPELFDKQRYDQTFKEAWLSKDYPEFAAWVKEHQYVIDELLKASKFDKCRFPLTDYGVIYVPVPMRRRATVRGWAYLLARAANNDIGEGRIDDAIDKWRCLLQIGNHLRQQPLFMDYLVAFAVEALGLNHAAVFAVEGDATKAHLNQIEAMPLHTADRWPAVLKEVLPVEELTHTKIMKQLGLLDRIKYEFRYGLLGSTKGRHPNRMREIYRRHLVKSRGLHILVALRRYKNKNGRWPEGLDEIRSSVPKEILVDPQNTGSFVYKLTDDGFKLYSKGQNNIDEDGQWNRTYDANTAELTQHEDDWPIWPPRGTKPKTKEENADRNQPNTSTEPVQ